MLGMQGLWNDLDIKLKTFEAHMKQYVNSAYDCGYEQGMMDANEKKEGKWIEEDISGFFTNYRCSVCGEVFCSEDIGISIESIYHFCPNCGADLREKKDGVCQGR